MANITPPSRVLNSRMLCDLCLLLTWSGSCRKEQVLFVRSDGFLTSFHAEASEGQPRLSSVTISVLCGVERCYGRVSAGQSVPPDLRPTPETAATKG